MSAILILILVFFSAECGAKPSKGAYELVDFSNATVTDDGSRECVNTTGMMEIYEKTPVYECVHKTEEQCHYTYVTQFEPTRQEECEENYEKSCQLTYRQVATNETHTHCYQPLVRKCDGEPLTSSSEGGVDDLKEVCKDWPETFCTTQYRENDGGQFVADTKCERIHTELCVPENCMMVPGPEKCHEQVVPSIHEVPEENCDLIPYENCVYKTKLVPKLKAVPVCTPVPRQFCTVKYVRGEKIRKEILSIWCRLIEKETTEKEEQQTTTENTLSEFMTTTQELVVDYDAEIPEITTDGNYDYTTDYEDDLPLYFPPPEGNYLASKPLLETTTMSMGYYPIKELNNAVVDNVNPMEDLTGFPVTQGNEMSEGISSTFSPDSITMTDVFLGEDETGTTFMPDMLQSVKNDSMATTDDDTDSYETLPSYLPPLAMEAEKPVEIYLPPPTVEAIAPVSDYLPPVEESVSPAESYLPPLIDEAQKLVEGYLPPLDVLESEKPVESYLPPVIEDEKPAESYLPPIMESLKPIESYMPPVIEDEKPAESNLPSVIEDEKPVESYLPPVIEDEKPVESYLPPVIEDEKPAESYLPPVIEDEKPVESYLPPIMESLKPVESYLPPVIEDEKPVESYLPPNMESEKPAESYLPPVIEDEKPVESYLPPIMESLKPVESYLPPVIEDEKPAESYLPPIMESEKHVESYLPPNVESVNPTQDYLSPALETYKPSVSYSPPNTGSSKPSIEYPLPSSELPSYSQRPVTDYLPPIDYEPPTVTYSHPYDYSPPANTESEELAHNYLSNSGQAAVASGGLPSSSISSNYQKPVIGYLPPSEVESNQESVSNSNKEDYTIAAFESMKLPPQEGYGAPVESVLNGNDLPLNWQAADAAIEVYLPPSPFTTEKTATLDSIPPSNGYLPSAPSSNSAFPSNGFSNANPDEQAGEIDNLSHVNALPNYRSRPHVSKTPLRPSNYYSAVTQNLPRYMKKRKSQKDLRSYKQRVGASYLPTPNELVEQSESYRPIFREQFAFPKGPKQHNRRARRRNGVPGYLALLADLF